MDRPLAAANSPPRVRDPGTTTDRGGTASGASNVPVSIRPRTRSYRRDVPVRVTPAPTGSQVAVKVDKDRLSAPGTSPASIGQTYDIYNLGKTDLARQDEFKETRYTWITDDRDDALEQVILERIQGRLGGVR